MIRFLLTVFGLSCFFSMRAQQVNTHVYKTIDGKQLKLDVYTAETISQAPQPVIIFFHGGGFIIGDRQLHADQCSYFTAKGMVAVSADYRLLAKGANPQTEVANCIKDAKSAVRWVKLHASKFNIDTSRVFLAGASAGGFLASAAALYGDINENTDNLNVSVKAQALILLNPAYTPEKRYTPPPARYISSACPPVIFFYGDQDKFKLGGEHFFNLLKKAGVSAEWWIANGETHSFYHKSGWNKAICRKSYNFLLKNGFAKGKYEKEVPDFYLHQTRSSQAK